ncbi:hypothetical protein GCM10010252_49820 [Streptomyces aureoverticillatus]|nr:hypothetical protein GCM10010252_49820 [Streptomyces aureoverticillatus]
MTRTRKIFVTLAVMAAATAGAASPALAESHMPAPPSEGHLPASPLGEGHLPAPPSDGHLPSAPFGEGHLPTSPQA